MDEQLIIELLTSRSEGTIKELSNLYGEKCMSIATGILNSREDAEECVNDAYLAVWNSIPPERPDSVAAYLYRVVRNIALMKYRYNTAEKRNSHYDVALDELAEFLKSTDDVQNMVETYSDNETMIKYHFADYDKAINFFELSSCFRELPGVVQAVAASYWSHSDLMGSEERHYDQIDLIVTTIKSDYQMNGGTYSLLEYYIVGPVANNAFIAQNLYETQNERIYVNQNGITLTLVDGYEEEKGNRVVDEMVTKVLLGYEHYMGAITFSGMKEKDIQKVLDYFDINE